MTDAFANKIKRLELENFTCFGKVGMDFSPGINVFIGENGTGKTHLLKVLYFLNLPIDGKAWGVELSDFFKVDVVAKLCRIDGENAKATLTWNKYRREFEIEFHLISQNNEQVIFGESQGQNSNDKAGEAIYMPPHEMLSLYEGFASAYEKRENRFDATYYFLAKALASLPLKEKALNGVSGLVAEIENQTGIKVLRRGEKFFVAMKNEEEFEATASAQGINKLAQLIYLIMNGSLTKDTILFWDEPEANLNPKYIVIVAKFLQTLANAGCQIFVATHDYLLPYELSLSKEYQDVETEKVPDMKFFSLYKGENGTEVEEGETMPDLFHDPIHEGLSLHQQREDILFRKSLSPNL